MKERKTLISVLEFLRTLALAVLLVSLFMSFVLRPMQVAGDSMAPVLHDGERVFINVLGGIDRAIRSALMSSWSGRRMSCGSSA